MKTKIEVTQEHIDRGIWLSCTKCPVALALKEVLKPGAVLQVDGSSIILDHMIWIDAPPLVRKWIRVYDSLRKKAERKTIKPISFTIDIPDTYAKG
jgi:hypothetical protein